MSCLEDEDIDWLAGDISSRIVLFENIPDFNPKALLVDKPALLRVPPKFILSLDPSNTAFFSSYDI